VSAIRLGIVTGVQFEAAVITKAARKARREVLVSCHGPGGARARAAADQLIGQGATHLLSFGIAAGVDPDVRVGATIVASGFLGAQGARHDADGAWAARLVRGLPDVRLGVIADSHDILYDSRAKAAHFAASGAPIADMESFAVAEAAAKAGIPCAAIRVVSDDARHSVPPFAFKGMTPDGYVRRLPVIIPMLMAPHKFPGLVRLAETTKAATKRLRKLADLGLARDFFAGGVDG
jgi:adenosylhomocysteine nucleosidase